MATTTTTSTPCSSSTPNSNLIHHHHFSMSSSSSSSIMKLKTLIHSLIFSHICRIARALSKAKSFFTNILKDINTLNNLVHFNKGTKTNTKHFKHKHHKVKVYGSFRLHYNWCSSASSHIIPEPDMFCPSQLVYYDSTWNSVSTPTGVNSSHQMGLSGYLEWLEEHENIDVPNYENNLKKVILDDHTNEIDKLADKFIASCHEKFKLEKQESYRRFKEMMARSM